MKSTSEMYRSMPGRFLVISEDLCAVHLNTIMQEHLQQYWTSGWRQGCVCVRVSWGPFAWATSSFWQEQHSDLWSSHVAVPRKLTVFGAFNSQVYFNPWPARQWHQWLCRCGGSKSYNQPEAPTGSNGKKGNLVQPWCHRIRRNSQDQKLNSAYCELVSDYGKSQTTNLKKLQQPHGDVTGMVKRDNYPEMALSKASELCEFLL